MEFGYTILYVQDVLKTVDFYKRAFDFEVKFVHESNQYAEMASGPTTLAFISEDFASMHIPKFIASRPKNEPLGFEIALVTDNIEVAFKRALEAGAEKILDPEQKPWGQIISYVRDINGILVEICTKIS